MEDICRNCPIGMFDSGIGGLTVVKELRKTVPYEQIVYFGDTARLPYGSKSDKLIIRYSLENTIFLNSKNVKLIVIACNTASAASAEYLRNFVKIPVIGVVECGASGAIRLTKNKRVGVIGTKSTIKSEAYLRAIRIVDPEIEVFQVATPLLVHLVEEGWTEKEITKTILKEYLHPLIKKNIDTIILGCTHYPLLTDQIKDIAGEINIVDSSKEIALLVMNTLKIHNLSSERKVTATTDIYLSDINPQFPAWARKFLGSEIKAQFINTEQYCFS